MRAAFAEVRDAAADHAVRQLAPRRDAQAAVVEIGALAALGDEELVCRRVVDHAGDEVALALERDRDREDRDAVQEVGGAVERVDVPGVALVGALDGAAFLHDEAVAGPRLRELLEQRGLGLLVGGGDEVARALDRDLQVLDLAEVALQPAPRLEGGGGHDVHQGGADHRGGEARRVRAGKVETRRSWGSRAASNR